MVILLNPIVAQPAMLDPIQYVWMFILAIIVEGLVAYLLLYHRISNIRKYLGLFIGVQSLSYVLTVLFSFLLVGAEYLLYDHAETQTIHWAELFPLIAEPLIYLRLLKAEFQSQVEGRPALSKAYLVITVLVMNVVSYGIGVWWQG